MDPAIKRISVVGTTGSGNSTLAFRVADLLGLDFIELDELNWEPGWVEAPLEVFRARVEAATRSEGWVCAGNYSRVQDIVWGRAQAVVWLDYPLPTVFWRLLVRTVRRSLTREKLWNGNVERLWPQLKLWSAESLFHWMFKTYWRRKREYPQLFALPEYAHLRVVHLRSPHAAEDLLQKISQGHTELSENSPEIQSAVPPP